MELDLLSKIAVGIFGVFLVFILFRYIKSNPDALSKENLGKSFYSMGLLGIALIGFVALVIYLLRA